MAKVHQHAEAIHLAVEESVEQVEVGEMRLTQRTARLPGGVEIVTLPANPRTARGFTGDLYLDEFAMHQHDREIWASAFPSITRGQGTMVVSSTPKGKQNLFYKLLSNEMFEHSTVTIYDAIADGYPANAEELRAGIDDEEIWRQEYLCEFVDEATAYLTFEMIQACERADLTCDLDPGFVPEGDLYLGGDIGRKKDLTCFWLWEELGDVLWTRAVIELVKMPFRGQFDILCGLLSLPRLRRACLDETGLGMQLAEDAQTQFGKTKVEPVTFTNAVKAEIAGGLRIRAEDQLLRIPPDPKIRNDWHSIKKTTTVAGNVRFDAERSDAGHADRFWAAGLGIHAAGHAKKRRPRAILLGV
jgi:phage FluMu gp28-like protein